MYKTIKILLFEDNPGDTGLIEEMVNESDDFSYELIDVETLDEGLNLLENNFFDVILLDLGLPDSEGINTFLDVQSKNPEIPIIILTGLNDTNIGINAVKNGAQDYLIKGDVDTKLLERSIKYSIEHKKTTEKIKKLANAVESSDDAIITKSLKGDITSWNRGAEQIYGYSAHEVLGKSISILEPSHRKGETEQLVERIKNGKKIRHYETTRIKKGSVLINVSVTCSPIFDSSGKLMAISTIARDVTEQKITEKELQEYRDTLEEQVKKRTEELANANTLLKMEVAKHKKTEAKLENLLGDLRRSNKELEQFAYVASHDLQEPLRMVSNFTQLLQKRYQGKLDSDADEFIEYAVEGAQRMQHLINDLLDYSRVTTRGSEFESVELETALNKSLVNLKVSIEENGAKVDYDPLPLLKADPSQVIQLFQNLIGNAIKFRGEETPEIYISAEEDGNVWIFSVMDNGIGIDPQHKQSIFKVFQRLHERETYPGTGIGLSICQKIVERHGGKIWVDSEFGNGSTFYFTISKLI